MIQKIILQGLLIITLFFGIWFGMAQLDFVGFFKVEEHSASLESTLGDVIWEEISDTESIITNDSIVKTLDALILPICEANDIERDSLKVHIVEKDELNAFALPNNHLVVYTGLITDCKKQEALQGVLGHEIAHIQHNHVMKKLSKEIGLTVLLSVVGGEKGGRVLNEILRVVSSTAYDRSLEKEADMASVKYLMKADIHPAPFADFMYELAQDSNLPKELAWISTHPESEERAKYIVEYIKDKKLSEKQTLTKSQWTEFQQKVK
jgi:predicted Zn-dependent protease